LSGVFVLFLEAQEIMESKDRKKKPYSRPTVVKLTTQQAKKIEAPDRKNLAKKKPQSAA